MHNGTIKSGTAHDRGIKLTSTQLFYKKLGAYLLLLYQSYLKKETHLEPEIKMALLRMVSFDAAFPVKIRMAQLDYLKISSNSLDADWDTSKDSLFPIEESTIVIPSSANRKRIIEDYKKAILYLLHLQN